MFFNIGRIVEYLDRFPNACVLCKQTKQVQRNLVCFHCLQDIEVYPSGTDQLPKLRINHNQCCYLDGLIVCNDYIWPFNDWIVSLKFSQKKHYAKVLAYFLSQVIPDHFYSFFDYYLPMPLHKERLRKRGYNQTEIICQFVDNLKEVERLKGVKRIKNTKPQTELTKNNRKKNVKGAFDLQEPLSGRRILIIDDVVSTGSTVDELAYCLKQQGANYVVALAICYNTG